VFGPAARQPAPAGRLPDGDGRIRLDGAMLGTRLAAQGAFEMVGVDGRGEPPPLDREVQAAFAAGVSELTIAGLPAYEFAASLRYAHIPGASRLLLVHDVAPSRKSFLVLFFKKERLAFFTSAGRRA